MSEKPQPKGVIAIWIDPTGDVISTRADFERQSYGGFKLWEAQRTRARRYVQWQAVRAYCSSVLSDCLSEYLLESIAEAMRHKGHKITIRSVGYDEETRAEIER